MPFNFAGPNVSRTVESAVYPIQVIGDSGNVHRVGPLVTPDELRNTYLFGIPLTSPLTKQSLSDPQLTTFINRALNTAEMLIGITIVETVRESRLPYDKQLNDYWWYTELPFKPITQINAWTIQTADNSVLYTVPAPLIEVKNAHLGQLSIGWSTIPTSSPVLSDGFYGNTAYVLIKNLAIFNTPGFWTISYVTGYPIDKIPSPVNQLIGTIASIDILSMLAPILRPNTSSALGIDGLSQSVSGPGPQWLALRLDDLRQRKEELIQQIKSYYYNTMIVSNF